MARPAGYAALRLLSVPGYAAAVYDVIMGAEQFQQWETHRKGLDWFMKYFPKQYMVLLD